VFAEAVSQELMVSNPIRGTKKFRADKFEATSVMAPWNLEETRKALEAADKSSDRALFYLLMMTGLRIGEALALTWDDVDFELQTLFVSKTVAHYASRRRDGTKAYQAVVKPPKTKNGNRNLKVSKVLLDALRLQQASVALSSSAGSDSWVDGNLVFPNQLGGYIDARNLRRRFYAFLKANGLRRIRLHDIRHGFATLALEDDPGSLPAVSKALGHASVAITMDIYGKTAEVDVHATKQIATLLFPDADNSMPVGANGAPRIGPAAMPLRSEFLRSQS
jgi:integrase